MAMVNNLLSSIGIYKSMIKDYVMKDIVSTTREATPMLFPFDPEIFWTSIRRIVSEEIKKSKVNEAPALAFETPGLNSKPLYKIADVCALFHVSKPTIYDWVKHGKLKPYKIRSRVYFLSQDIKQLIDFGG